MAGADPAARSYSPVPGLCADTDAQNIVNIAVRSSTSRRDCHAPACAPGSPAGL